MGVLWFRSIHFYSMISMDGCVQVFLIEIRLIDSDLLVTQWNPELRDKIKPV